MALNQLRSTDKQIRMESFERIKKLITFLLVALKPEKKYF